MRCDAVLWGLGNPGIRYRTTYHNIGTLFVEFLAEYYQAPWEKNSRHHADFAQIVEGERTFLLVRSHHYMNAAGGTARALKEKSGIQPHNVCVLADNADQPLYKVQHRMTGGAKGHNGIRSIQVQWGNSFRRLWLGIGRNTQPLDQFVLSPISPAILHTYKNGFSQIKSKLLAWEAVDWDTQLT